MVFKFYNLSQKLAIRNYASFREVSEWYRNWFNAQSTPPFSHIVQIGDPVLRNKSEEISTDLIKSARLQQLIKHLQTVQRKYKSIGISAPQIGIPWRIFIMELNERALETFDENMRNNRQMEPIASTVFINPVLKILEYKKITFPEACESVRGFTADVARYSKVQCSALDAEGNPVSMVASGWTARVIQHEMDHLNGKMYTDIMQQESLTCTCWQAVNVHSGRIKLPFSP